MSLKVSRNPLAAVVAIDSASTHLGQYAAVRAAIDSTSTRLGQYAAVQVHSCYWQQQHAVGHIAVVQVHHAQQQHQHAPACHSVICPAELL